MNKKDCPYCNKPLELGRIRVPHGLGMFWLPNGVSMPLLPFVDRFVVEKGAVSFRRDLLTVTEVDARYCRKCNYIHIDVEENHGKYDKTFHDKQQ